MTRLLVALIAAAIATVEASVTPGGVSAVLPVALIACWGVLRGADEVMLAAPAVAVPLGLLSEERVGWFIIALLPLLLALALMARDEQRARNAAIGAAIAGGGCTAFGLVLLLTVEHPRAVAAEVPALLAASGVAAMLAGFGVFALWQWRARTHGLFA